MSKNNRILIYVEGESEAVFFNQYMKQYLKHHYGINIECQAGDIPSFKRKVTRGMYSDYKQIFVLRDLKTQRLGYQDYHCVTNMKSDFTTQSGNKFVGKIGRSYKFIVVCNEIESWALTFKRSTNNRSERHYSELFEYLRCGDKKPPCMKKYVDKLKKGEVSLEISNNKSFEYFINELQKCK